MKTENTLNKKEDTVEKMAPSYSLAAVVSKSLQFQRYQSATLHTASQSHHKTLISSVSCSSAHLYALK